MNDILTPLLKDFVDSPRDPWVNFRLGQFYDASGHVAAALSYYLRTAELTEDKELAYTCLLRNYLNFNKQTRRSHSAKGQLLHAIALLPTRPEAYYHLSRFYETKQEWQEGYAAILQAIENSTQELPNLPYHVDYPGAFVLRLQKALLGWRIGQCNSARTQLRDLMNTEYMPEYYGTLTRNNLINLKGELFPITTYTKDKHSQLKYKFNKSDEIDRNFAQTYQDMFVLTMLNGKTEGKYLEIGSADPFHNNNTALLETNFNWKGVSIDIDEKEVQKFAEARNNTVLQANALEIDYKELLDSQNLGNIYDYLQLDCDPPENTYQIMTMIPFDTYKFAVITFEHDYYANPSSGIREKSREYLKEKGYLLVASDISADCNSSYEDWYVHPELVDFSTIETMINTQNRIKKAEHYMLDQL